MQVERQSDLEKLAVFDVCDTLYFSNTTHDFVAFHFDRSPLSSSKLIFGALNNKLSPVRYFLIFVGKVLGIDLMKTVNLRLMRGQAREDLETMADEFTRTYLSDRRIERTHQSLEEYRALGYRVVLCSSSVEPVVRSIANDLRVEDYVSTELAYEESLFTGKTLRDTVGNKVEDVCSQFPDAVIEIAVSDNTTDLDLLQASKKAIAVVHSERKLRFWNAHDVDVIDVRK